MMRVRISILVWTALSTAESAQGVIRGKVTQEWASTRKFERKDANFDILIMDQRVRQDGWDLRREHNMTRLSKALDQSLFFLNVKKLRLSLIIRSGLRCFQIANAVHDV